MEFADFVENLNKVKLAKNNFSDYKDKIYNCNTIQDLDKLEREIKSMYSYIRSEKPIGVSDEDRMSEELRIERIYSTCLDIINNKISNLLKLKSDELTRSLQTQSEGKDEVD